MKVMVDDEQEFCEWFNQYDAHKIVDKFLSDRNIGRVTDTIAKCLPPDKSWSGKEEQQIKVRTFACIDPDEVNYQKDIVGRFEAIERWANKRKLRSFPSSIQWDDETGDPEFTNCKAWNYHMPVFSRLITYNDYRKGDIPKFTVTDGRHRTAYAKDKGICLMAEVTEFLTLTEKDLENQSFVEKKSIKENEDISDYLRKIADIIPED